jgi:hypothetical protein
LESFVESAAGEGAGGVRQTGVDTSVESASGAGGTRGQATTGEATEGVDGSGGCVAPIK